MGRRVLKPARTALSQGLALALLLAARGAGAQPTAGPQPAGTDAVLPEPSKVPVVSPAATLPRSSTQSQPADPDPPPPKIAVLWPAKAYRRGVFLDADIVATTLEPAGTGNRDAYVAMALAPTIAAQFWGEMHGGGGFAEVEVPFGFSLSSFERGDLIAQQRVLFGNLSFSFRYARGGVDSTMIWSWGTRITVPTNDGEFSDFSEPFAVATLASSRAGYDLHRFTSAYFVAAAPAMFEWRTQQLLVSVEMSPLLFLPTFQRFAAEPARAGAQGAAEVAGRTSSDGIRLLAGLRIQGVILTIEDAAASPSVPWFASPEGGRSAAYGVQRGFAEAAVEPFVGVEHLCWNARAGALIPFTRPLGFGIHPDNAFTVRLSVAQRF